MELLYLFGMSVKAAAWFYVITAAIVGLIICLGAAKSDETSDIFNLLSQKTHIDLKNLPDEITIEIVKESPEKPSASQSESYDQASATDVSDNSTEDRHTITMEEISSE